MARKPIELRSILPLPEGTECAVEGGVCTLILPENATRKNFFRTLEKLADHKIVSLGRQQEQSHTIWKLLDDLGTHGTISGGGGSNLALEVKNHRIHLRLDNPLLDVIQDPALAAAVAPAPAAVVAPQPVAQPEPVEEPVTPPMAEAIEPMVAAAAPEPEPEPVAAPEPEPVPVAAPEPEPVPEPEPEPEAEIHGAPTAAVLPYSDAEKLHAYLSVLLKANSAFAGFRVRQAQDAGHALEVVVTTGTAASRIKASAFFEREILPFCPSATREEERGQSFYRGLDVAHFVAALEARHGARKSSAGWCNAAVQAEAQKRRDTAYRFGGEDALLPPAPTPAPAPAPVEAEPSPAPAIAPVPVIEAGTVEAHEKPSAQQTPEARFTDGEKIEAYLIEHALQVGGKHITYSAKHHGHVPDRRTYTFTFYAKLGHEDKVEAFFAQKVKPFDPLARMAQGLSQGKVTRTITTSGDNRAFAAALEAAQPGWFDDVMFARAQAISLTREENSRRLGF